MSEGGPTTKSGKVETFRFDVLQEVLSFDEKTGVALVRFIPNPRRYDRVANGYYDKLEGFVITDEAIRGMAEQLSSTPVYFQRPEIDDSVEYVDGRKDAIRRRLRGESPTPTFANPSDEFLASVTGQTLGFAVLSLDVVGSTRLATAEPAETYRRIMDVLLFEVAECVPKFGGQVLKYTGDGVIAYFAAPSFNRKNDMALDCALTLRWLVYKGINPELADAGLPPIDVRIGMDAGWAYVDTVGSPASKQGADIVGAVVNLAVKVQALASPSEITVGEAADRSLYVDWRDYFEVLQLPQDWPYRGRDGFPYRVFRMTARQTRLDPRDE